MPGSEQPHIFPSNVQHPPNRELAPGTSCTEVIYQAADFNLADHMYSICGPVVEVGGPTYYGQRSGYDAYRILDPSEKPTQPLMVTNNNPRIPGVQQAADASCLPFREGSIGGLFASHLPHYVTKRNMGRIDLHRAFISQAYRCLEVGGILVMQGAHRTTVELSIELGFEPVRIIETYGRIAVSEGLSVGSQIFDLWDFVALKPPSTT